MEGLIAAFLILACSWTAFRMGWLSFDLLPAFMIIADMKSGGGQGLKAIFTSLLRNQFLWAIGLAMLINLIRIPLPTFLHDASSLLGRAAAPVALITVGGILAKTKSGSHITPALLANFSKLIVLPALGLMFAKLFGVPRDLAIILTLFMAIPSAALLPMFGEQVSFAELSNSVFIYGYLAAFFTLAAWLLILT